MLDARQCAGQGPPRRMPGDVGREDAAARIRVAQRDDFGLSRVHARQHDRGFDRLSPAVGEERRIQSAGGDVGETLRHLDLILGQVERGGVAQGPDLLPNPLHDLGMAVSHRRRENTAEQVQELTAFGIDDVDAVAFHKNERLGVVGWGAGEQEFLVTGFHRSRIDSDRSFGATHVLLLLLAISY